MEKHRYAFTAKSPANTDNVMAILLPHEPKEITVGADTYETQWDGKDRLLHLRFENKPEGVKVCIRW